MHKFAKITDSKDILFIKEYSPDIPTIAEVFDEKDLFLNRLKELKNLKNRSIYKYHEGPQYFVIIHKKVHGEKTTYDEFKPSQKWITVLQSGQPIEIKLYVPIVDGYYNPEEKYPRIYDGLYIYKLDIAKKYSFLVRFPVNQKTDSWLGPNWLRDYGMRHKISMNVLSNLESQGLLKKRVKGKHRYPKAFNRADLPLAPYSRGAGLSEEEIEKRKAQWR
jgi:hypothetical protein